MHDFWTIVRELRRGKSLGRTLQNLVCSQISLSGKILDVGGGGKKRSPSYRLFMPVTPDSVWMVADYDRALQPDLCFDASRPWPISAHTFDRVLLMNCLYIFQHPQRVIHEAARVLRNNGELVVSAPMIFHAAPEPGDYFRFTAQGIQFLVQNAGLTVAALIPYGGRFVCAVELIRPYLKKLRLFFPMAILAHFLDQVFEPRLEFERQHPVRSGCLVVAKKADLDPSPKP